MNKDVLSMARVQFVCLGLMALGLALLTIYFLSYRFLYPELIQVVEEHQTADNQSEIMSMVAKLMERVQKDPQDKQSLLTLAHVFMKMEVWDQAISFWEKFLQLSPTDQQARQQLAWCYFKAKEFSQARDELALVLAKEPDNIYALYNQGIIYKYFLHQPALGNQRFQRIVALGPKKGKEDIFAKAKEELAQK